jgi:hypothetical protein
LAAHLLTRDEARRIAANIAKLLDGVLDAGPLCTTPGASALAGRVQRSGARVEREFAQFIALSGCYWSRGGCGRA